MNWEYQSLVMYDGPNHFGLCDMEDEEAVVSLVVTSVEGLSYGHGKIAFFDLDLASNLSSDLKSSTVPKSSAIP